MARIYIIFAFSFIQLLFCTSISEATSDFNLDTSALDTILASHSACRLQLYVDVFPCVNKTQSQITQLVKDNKFDLAKIEQVCCLGWTMSGCFKPTLNIAECKDAKPKIADFIAQMEKQFGDICCEQGKVCKNGVTQDQLSFGLVVLVLSFVVLFQSKLFN